MDGCIEWTEGRTNEGYGYKRHEGKSWLAHRWAWMMKHGPIPEGLCVLHRCDNPPCVNVDHLFLGTRVDNNNDKMAKGRHVTSPGERNGSAKLTVEQVREIRASTATHRVLAERYGISRTSISYIKNRVNWSVVG